ncbi:MAG: peptidoglycan-binding protein [Burkholderiaceae bacterium]
MTDVPRSNGSKRVREAFSAQAALADRSSTPPPDAFERRFWQRSRHRDATVPASQSRPWVLWFLIIALSGSVLGAVFWSDTSISRDSARQVVGSDPAWRGVIRQTRPATTTTPRASAASEVLTQRPAAAAGSQTLDASPELSVSTPSSLALTEEKPLAKVAPVAKIAAAYASTIESARELAGKAGLVTETAENDREPERESAIPSNNVARVPAAPSVVSAAAATPSPDRLGDPTVLAIQGLLSKNGFAPGPADGLMGTRTRTAILAWQLQQGLPTVGRADKAVLEQLLDPQKARSAADRLPISVLAQSERDALETWCTAGRNAGNLVAYYECMGSEVAKLSSGLRMPEVRQEASGNLDAFATARLLCTDQASAAPQVYFKCLHNELSQDKPLFVME